VIVSVAHLDGEEAARFRSGKVGIAGSTGRSVRG
jgi:hypothetical protein